MNLSRRGDDEGMGAGRFAPSPTGELHVGNLRTAMLSWLFARHRGDRYLVRIEDLDTGSVREEHVSGQLHDLIALGLGPDEPPIRQSERSDVYEAALTRLAGAGLTYDCFCSRREVREAASAPNGPLPPGAYPGTCRDLDDAERRRRHREGRAPAVRLKTAGELVGFVDEQCGPYTGQVDDMVLRRGDGAIAYNLAVVVDDADQGVTLVVRGDDLVSSTPRQIHLARLLGIAPPSYAHVPLVLAEDGSRLAKRHGSVTLADRLAAGDSPARVLGRLGASLGLCDEGPVALDDLLAAFAPARLPTSPWVWSEPA